MWCEWAEMELRHENYEEAIRVMQRAERAARQMQKDGDKLVMNVYDKRTHLSHFSRHVDDL